MNIGLPLYKTGGHTADLEPKKVIIPTSNAISKFTESLACLPCLDYDVTEVVVDILSALESSRCNHPPGPEPCDTQDYIPDVCEYWCRMFVDITTQYGEVFDDHQKDLVKSVVCDLAISIRNTLARVGIFSSGKLEGLEYCSWISGYDLVVSVYIDEGP